MIGHNINIFIKDLKPNKVMHIIRYNADDNRQNVHLIMDNKFSYLRGKTNSRALKKLRVKNMTLFASVRPFLINCH